MRIGEIISNYLEEHNLSQRQFARDCGLSNSIISMFVSEKASSPTLGTLYQLSAGMNISIDQLLNELGDDTYPTHTDEHTSDVIDSYYSLNKEDRKAIDSYMDFLLSKEILKNKDGLVLSTITDKEASLLLAYRNHPEMQNVVDKILDLSNNEI